jgi:hypothetical protein
MEEENNPTKAENGRKGEKRSGKGEKRQERE